jgi:hypothetical protein
VGFYWLCVAVARPAKQRLARTTDTSGARPVLCCFTGSWLEASIPRMDGLAISQLDSNVVRHVNAGMVRLIAAPPDLNFTVR